MQDTTKVFQSRWGYHPCDHGLFLKLKYLRKCYWQTIYDFHRWHRWWRKEEQNRVGAAPKYCPVFVENKTWYKEVLRHGQPAVKLYPRTVVDNGVLELYETARRPQPDPIAPYDDQLRRRIESMYESVKAHIEK